MHCQACGAAHRGRGRLCDECEKTLSGLSGPNKSPAPVGGFEADKGLIASGYRRPLSKEGGWDGPTLVRTNVMPIALGGRFLKRGWLTAFGAAGLAAAIAQMAFRWNVSWFWLIVPSGFAFFVGYRLIRTGFFRFENLVNFEADQAGRVYITTLGGDCPVCNGEIKLKAVGPKGQAKIVIQCTEDRIHQWAFDPRRLDGLSP